MPTALKLKLTLILLLPLLVSGCVYYPHKIEHYDEQCKIAFNTLELQTEEMKDACAKVNSSDPSGAACLGGILTLTAASAIVSGSLVLVGNTAYWLEKKGRCLAQP